MEVGGALVLVRSPCICDQEDGNLSAIHMYPATNSVVTRRRRSLKPTSNSDLAITNTTLAKKKAAGVRGTKPPKETLTEHKGTEHSATLTVGNSEQDEID